MTGTEPRGALSGIVGSIGELLKNRAIVEAVVAGIGAFSAANKVKTKNTSSDGIDFSSVLDMLPQIMPILSLFTQSDGGIFGNFGSAEGKEAVFQAAAETETDAIEADASETDTSETDAIETDVSAMDASAEATEVSTVNKIDAVSYASQKDNRENLLLALRPFLSESRAAAADAIISVNRISGLLG